MGSFKGAKVQTHINNLCLGLRKYLFNTKQMKATLYTECPCKDNKHISLNVMGCIGCLVESGNLSKVCSILYIFLLFSLYNCDYQKKHIEHSTTFQLHVLDFYKPDCKRNEN